MPNKQLIFLIITKLFQQFNLTFSVSVISQAFNPDKMSFNVV